MPEIVDRHAHDRLRDSLTLKVKVPPFMLSAGLLGQPASSQCGEAKRIPTNPPPRRVIHLAQSLPEIFRDPAFELILLLKASRTGIAFLFYEQLFPCEVLTLIRPNRNTRFEVFQTRKLDSACFHIEAQRTG